jgi:ribosomal protein S18 acetylase RimI-like enzyme
MSAEPRAGHALAIEIATAIGEHDLEDLCEATNAAIIEGGGFGWISTQDRAALARHFRGVLLVPDRILFLARLDGVVVGSAQLVRPARNNEAQAFAAQLNHAYIAPYARGFGLARRLVERVEEHAAAVGFRVLNLDVRETQESAIALFESLGYQRWGTHPAYARVDGRTVAGHFYYKLLEPGRGRSTESLIGGA